MAHVLFLQIKPDWHSSDFLQLSPKPFLTEAVETHLLPSQEAPDRHSSDRRQNIPSVAGAWHVVLPPAWLARHMGLLRANLQSASASQFGSFLLSYWHVPFWSFGFLGSATHFKSLEHVRPPFEDFASAVQQLSPTPAAQTFVALKHWPLKHASSDEHLLPAEIRPAHKLFLVFLIQTNSKWMIVMSEENDYEKRMNIEKWNPKCVLDL
jgi:hypothetical protein